VNRRLFGLQVISVTHFISPGGTHLPEADSDRIIVGAWWLVVLVIVTSYSGNLVAFLTFPKYEVAVTNVEELLTRRGAISWGILKDTAVEQHLKVTSFTDVFFQPCLVPSMIVFRDFKINLSPKHIALQNIVHKYFLLYLCRMMKYDSISTISTTYSLRVFIVFLMVNAQALTR
jgi:hypothetical protein